MQNTLDPYVITREKHNINKTFGCAWPSMKLPRGDHAEVTPTPPPPAGLTWFKQQGADMVQVAGLTWFMQQGTDMVQAAGRWHGSGSRAGMV